MRMPVIAAVGLSLFVSSASAQVPRPAPPIGPLIVLPPPDPPPQINTDTACKPHKELDPISGRYEWKC